MGRLIAAILLLAALPATLPLARDYPVTSPVWTDEYDRHFRKYSKRYFGPMFDWHWFKAQAIAESGLNAEAKSPAGAIGLMQILPSTFSDINLKNPHYLELEDPRWNIAAGIYYDRALYTKFNESPEVDKMYLALASYNAGYGRLLNVKKRLKEDRLDWDKARTHLPGETQAYVSRIQRLMDNEG
jgi:soluble lytic murein transglycosylase-like protein